MPLLSQPLSSVSPPSAPISFVVLFPQAIIDFTKTLVNLNLLIGAEHLRRNGGVVARPPERP